MDLSLEEVMGDRFGRYAKAIIQDRAIPDVRDGLKPVQRRILYGMYNDHNTYDKPTRKSAKTVGYIMGNFHPHGDSSIYDAMVRMSQWWKQSTPYIEMQGNNGSMDGDGPAASRYTECKLSKIAEATLTDIKKNSVNWLPNFDETKVYYHCNYQIGDDYYFAITYHGTDSGIYSINEIRYNSDLDNFQFSSGYSVVGTGINKMYSLLEMFLV